jgi:hypothetical protein
MCKVCNIKKAKKKWKLVSKLIMHISISNYFQVDLINMKTRSDRTNKFTMVNQDYFNKFLLPCALQI